jgi:hypothetical protein
LTPAKRIRFPNPIYQRDQEPEDGAGENPMPVIFQSAYLFEYVNGRNLLEAPFRLAASVDVKKPS